MNAMTTQQIAADIRQYLLGQIRSTVKSEAYATDYFCRHARVCLTNEDKSAEPYWYAVTDKEQVIAIKNNFCAGIEGYTEESADEIIDAIIIGYHIDFSKPTYLAYDLNLLVPILN